MGEFRKRLFVGGKGGIFIWASRKRQQGERVVLWVASVTRFIESIVVTSTFWSCHARAKLEVPFIGALMHHSAPCRCPCMHAAVVTMHSSSTPDEHLADSQGV